jgi:L-amino acid N-acyltransferase YncA
MALEGFPKKANLRDGSQVLLRPLSFEDSEGLLLLYRGLPEEDRLVLRDDVTRPEWSERFLTKVALGDVLSIVAEENGRLVGEASLYRQRHGWTAHVGELRVSVDRAHRLKGLGFVLARELVMLARVLGLEKLLAQMVETQVAARRVFERLGFVQEAILKGHVKDAGGHKRDLHLLSSDTSIVWKTMEALVADSVQTAGK